MNDDANSIQVQIFPVEVNWDQVQISSFVYMSVTLPLYN